MHIRWTRPAKWAGVCGCIGLAMVWPVNLRWSAYWLTGSSPPMWQVTLVGGAVTATHFDTPLPGALARNSRGPVGFQVAQAPPIGLHWWVTWSDATNAGTGVRVRSLGIPLWLAGILWAVPTAWLWHLDRRPPPGACRKCGYDLTGITIGLCPECGRQATR